MRDKSYKAYNLKTGEQTESFYYEGIARMIGYWPRVEKIPMDQIEMEYSTPTADFIRFMS